MTATALPDLSVWASLAAGPALATAQPDYTGSCMIALYPPPDVAEQLAVPGGLPPEDIHLTIAYTGDCADVGRDALAAAAQALASRPPLEAAISGHARFTGGDDGDVIVALADSPDLDVLRRDAEAVLAARGIALPSEHGFTAHMTLCYQGPEDPDPVGRLAPLPVTFTGISAEYGTQRYTFPFCAAPGGGDTPGPEAAWDHAWDALREAVR